LEKVAAKLGNREKGLSSPGRLGKYGINCQNLDKIGVASVEEALRGKEIIVIDEIGKMEKIKSFFKFQE